MSKPVTFEHIRSKTALNQVTAPSMPFSWSLNPYRGCQHGCSFCYARSTHSFLGMETDDTFQKHIFIKENVPEALEEQLRKAARSRGGLKKFGKVAVGTATDPYQPVEAKARLTRQALELFARYGVPVSVTTRSPLILRDIDLLQAIPDATVNISLNTLNLKIWRDFEPFTPSPLERLKTIGRLGEMGIRAGIFMAPILPLLMDTEDELRRLLGEARSYAPRFVMPSYLRLNTRDVKVWFFQTLRTGYPHLVEEYARFYASSPYLPADYRKEGIARVNTLLEEYGFISYEPYSGREGDEDEASEEKPVQLSFAF
ncbi:SPL family radical SAM protein [Paenibacillus hamazuiensis]|uniref:SPL family radical SAM protein n=1 Tax=Paenibacillus hamazuiensis TaxID=2936508 RepID=UPI00200DF460|nr:radical SAM protein [Paenibacillus hamazuiensis]